MTDTKIYLCDYTKLNDTFNILTPQEPPVEKRKILGLNYKGRFYRTVDEDNFSATPGDVRKDKTFIGARAIAETGTLEV